MARIRKKIQKRDRELVQQVPVASSLESRPFDLEAESSEGEYVPEVQAKEDSIDNFGNNLGNISISTPETADEVGSLQVQAKEDDDLAELTPQEEEQTAQVQAKEEEEETPQVQAKEDDDLAELTPQQEEETPQVQAKEDEDSEQVQAKSEEETEELKQKAQQLYEQFLEEDEAAIATLEEDGLDLEMLQSLSAEDAIAAIQEILETPVSA